MFRLVRARRAVSKSIKLAFFVTLLNILFATTSNESYVILFVNLSSFPRD